MQELLTPAYLPTLVQAKGASRSRPKLSDDHTSKDKTPKFCGSTLHPRPLTQTEDEAQGLNVFDDDEVDDEDSHDYGGAVEFDIETFKPEEALPYTCSWTTLMLGA